MGWSVPSLWPGRTVAILASGPSMSRALADRVHAAGLPAIVINDTYRLAPWADMLYAADEAWWQQYPDALAFEGLKVSVGQVRGVLELSNSGVTGFDPNPANLRTGSNSGYQALHIAVHAGAKRVLLCGFNMTGRHWFGGHPASLVNTSEHLYDKFRRNFETILPALAERGIEVLNCTFGSALKCFQMRDLDDELARDVAERVAA